MTDSMRTASAAREVRLAPGAEVHLLLTANDLRIRGVDGDRVTIRARDGEDIDDQVQVETLEGSVEIRDAARGIAIGPVRIGGGQSAALDIDVPRAATVGLRTMSGDVEGSGLSGTQRWSSASGSLRISVDGGTLQLDSMSGDVTVDSTAPIALRARSVSGDVRVRAPRIDGLDASTTSGDIRVTAALGTGREHQLRSVSGDVDLVTASPVRLETQTIAGDVRGYGPYTAEGGRGRRSIVVGNGSIPVSARTMSGDIRLRADGDPAGVAPSMGAPSTPLAPLAPQAPLAPARPAPAVDLTYLVAEAEAAPNLVRPTTEPAAAGPWQGGEGVTDRREAARLEVLRALERGELDVEAASHRLEQLEDAGPRAFRGWC